MFEPAPTPEARLTSQVLSCLDEHRVTAGFGALACGADILVAEALLSRSAQLHIHLPFSQDRFAETSVSIGGEAWLPRYQDCFSRATSVSIVATETRSNPYIAASRAAMAAARARDPQALQISLFDGADADADVGTGSDIADWKSLGGRTIIIPTSSSLRLPKRRTP